MACATKSGHVPTALVYNDDDVVLSIGKYPRQIIFPKLGKLCLSLSQKLTAVLYVDKHDRVTGHLTQVTTAKMTKNVIRAV